MTWGFRAQRRAEEFDTLVERASTEEITDVGASRDAELLTLVGALRGVPDAEPRPEFVTDLRARLMAEAETALAPTDLARLRLPARHTRKERRLAAIVGGIAIVGATTSVAVAAQSSLPGESLYPIKRVLESAHSGLVLGDAQKGKVELGLASSRLDEVSELSRDPGLGDEQRIASTLGAFTDQATRGADLLLADYGRTQDQSSIVKLHDFASSSLDQLEELEPQVPYSARDELISAAGLLAQIDGEATQRCPTCGGTPIGSLPPALSAAEQIVLPDLPTANPTPARAHHAHGKKNGKGHGGTTQPDLPDINAAPPPGSVTDPDDSSGDPSSSPNPIKALTDGLTGALTGGQSNGGGTSGGQDGASSGPVGQVLDGVGGILHGVLDPITGTLLPKQP